MLEAFGLAPGAIVAAVGGGGKTSLVFWFAGAARAAGLEAVVTTTVKFTPPAGGPMPPLVEAEPGAAVAAAADGLARYGAVTLISGRGERGRMLGFAPEVVEALGGPRRIVAVEADGSAHRPFKAPAEHEPVVPAGATDVVVCVGLSVLGRPLDGRWVHRPERVARLAGLCNGMPVTEEAIARVVLHPEGGHKGVPPRARLHALLNQPVDLRRARALAELLVAGGAETVVVAAAHEGRVLEVVRA